MSESRKITAMLVADPAGRARLAGADEDRAPSRICGLLELADTRGENTTLEPPEDFDGSRRASARIGAGQCAERLDWEAGHCRLALNAR